MHTTAAPPTQRPRNLPHVQPLGTLEMIDEPDDQAAEIQEWSDAISSVIAFGGTERADVVLGKAVETARRSGARIPFAANTAYMNTIPPSAEPAHPGVRRIEQRIRSAIRWNAAAIVLKANKESSELGGHIASFQSAATLYDTGFMHFWHAPTEKHGGDLVFVQGHSSPGVYARAYLEGRLSEAQSFLQLDGRQARQAFVEPNQHDRRRPGLDVLLDGDLHPGEPGE